MGGGGGRPASRSLVHSTDLGRAPEEMVVVRGQSRRDDIMFLCGSKTNFREVSPARSIWWAHTDAGCSLNLCRAAVHTLLAHQLVVNPVEADLGLTDTCRVNIGVVG